MKTNINSVAFLGVIILSLVTFNISANENTDANKTGNTHNPIRVSEATLPNETANAARRDSATFPKPIFEQSDALAKLTNHQWRHGSRFCWFNSDPAIEVYQYSPSTYILRQNKCQHYEAPFIYVLFGKDKVLVQDTGATADADEFPLYTTIIELVEQRAQNTGQTPSDFEIIVSHSHSHSDHVAGDTQFIDKPGVTLIKPELTAVKVAFGYSETSPWPDTQVQFDLGGRVLTVLPIPGHQSESVAIFDEQTRWLLTGDSLYPGRLYVKDWVAFQASVKKLSDFASNNSVSAVMGTHIEMSAEDGVDYEMGSTYQPNEAALPMSVIDLHLLNKILQDNDTPKRVVTDNFIVYPLG